MFCRTGVYVASRSASISKFAMTSSKILQPFNILSKKCSNIKVSRPFCAAAAKIKEEHEFQADTKQLLNIVANTLYSEKEVFIRELISNASDANEKFRYLLQTGANVVNADRQLNISVTTDKVAGTITIKDNGIGMTREEMINNLGTIARSGSKEFMEKMSDSSKSLTDSKDIIGQFGVGFYSAFMVADKIEVYSRSSTSEITPRFLWTSDGNGSYSTQEIDENETAENGTRIVIYLKSDCREYCDEIKVKEVIKRYSKFVGFPITINGTPCDDLKPIWLMEPSIVTDELHDDFYRQCSGSFDKPRFTLHFRSEAPMDVKALLYVSESRPGMFETSRDENAGSASSISLYSRKVLVRSKADNLVPKWMRFVKGVVDSEDIPLNLSREILQNSSQIRKLRNVITNKFLRFLQDRAFKDSKSFMEFYKDYSFFLKEGIITSNETYEKEEIAKLLLFESSTQPAGETVSLPVYISRMKPGQRDIYYLASPNRHLAEHSPYLEGLKHSEYEILFCYESYDELILMQLGQFDKIKLTSVEKQMRQGDEQKEDVKVESSQTDRDALINWFQSQLGRKAAKVKITKRLEQHPCVVTVEEMAAARHFIKTQGATFSEEQRYEILQPQLEINESHPIIVKLNELRNSNPMLASLVAEQLFANAMVIAGLVEDPRTVLRSMNDLLVAALEKH